MRLNKEHIDALEPPERGYVIHWDDDLRGFGLRVTQSGVKSFVLQRRINGRERRITIGRYGESLPADKARKVARKLDGQIIDGLDPVAEKQRQRAETVTLREAFDDYLHARSLKPLTQADMKRAMKGFNDWMPRPITRITREMVSRRHRKLGGKSPARANLAMRYLRAVLNFAAEEYTHTDGTPILMDNPVRKLSAQKTWYRVDRRKTVIREHQLKPWMQAVMRLGDTPEREPGEGRKKPTPRHGSLFRDYLLFVLLTGLRRSEALNLAWQDVDFDGGTFTVRDPKNHEDHTLPMSDFLRELLERRRKEGGPERVFTDAAGVGLGNFRYVLDRVATQSGVAFTLHDLRRTFATVADSLDIPGYAVKRLLNHKMTADVTAGYIVADVERLRRPMQKITDYMLAAGGVRSGADVVSLTAAPAAGKP